MIRAIGLFAALWPALASGASPADHAVGWPIEMDRDAPAFRLELPLAVYAELADPGLRDLAVFNAHGEPVPFGVIDGPTGRPQDLQQPVPFFELPLASASDPAGSLRLQVERDIDGRLRRLDAELPDAVRAAGQSWLLDLSRRTAPVDRLLLDWHDVDALSARVRVSASDDLTDWRTLRDDAPLLDLQRDGLRLRKHEIGLPLTGARYLLLTRRDGGASLPLRAIVAGGPSAGTTIATPIEWITLDPKADSDDPNIWYFRTPGPLPISRIDVELASDNSVAQLAIASRAGDGGDGGDTGDWHHRHRLVAFSLRDGGDTLASEPVALGVLRDRDWRIVAAPGLDRPPRLRLGYRPDRFVLLARGDAPFLLAAGSATARRADYPIEELLAALRARREPQWQPPDARLGAIRPLAGDPARRAPWPWQRGLLWVLLVGGAALVIVMVLRLARQPPAG